MSIISHTNLNLVSSPQFFSQQANGISTRCGLVAKPPENNNTCCKPDDGKGCNKPNNDGSHCNKPGNNWDGCHRPNNSWNNCSRPGNNGNGCSRPNDNGNSCSGSRNECRPGNGKNDYNSDNKTILRQLADILQKLSNQAGRDLKAASGSNDPYNVLKANRSMSNYYLNNQFVSKMISKMTNCVERMTNLQ